MIGVGRKFPSFHPKGVVSNDIVRFVYVTDSNVRGSPEAVLHVLDALQTDELCPSTGRRVKTA